MRRLYIKKYHTSSEISKKLILLLFLIPLVIVILLAYNYDLFGVTGGDIPALMNRPSFLSPLMPNLQDISDFSQQDSFITPDHLLEAQFMYGLASVERITVSALTTGHDDDIEILGLGNVFCEDFTGIKDNLSDQSDNIYEVTYKEVSEQFFSNFMQMRFFDLISPGCSPSLVEGEYNFSTSKINIEGKLSITSLDAEIVVSNAICFYADSYLEAVLGAKITLNAAVFNVLSTSPQNLQFQNLNLIVNESVNILEVACAELIENYFDQNFAFNSIELNGALTLIDLVDNQLDGEGNEVLYVRNLIFNENGEIDLGSTTLYYEKLFLGDTEVELEDVDGRYSNGQLQQIYPPAPTAMPVPEPSVFVLSLFGFCILRKFVKARKFTARIN